MMAKAVIHNRLLEGADSGSRISTFLCRGYSQSYQPDTTSRKFQRRCPESSVETLHHSQPNSSPTYNVFESTVIANMDNEGY
jgi:hypothetical protein